jgi:hypothetical protein
VGKVPLNETEGEPARGGAPALFGEFSGGHLQEYPPLDQGIEAPVVGPEGGVPLRMGEQKPVTACLQLGTEGSRRWSAGSRRGSRLGVESPLTVGDKAQFLIRYRLGPHDVHLVPERRRAESPTRSSTRHTRLRAPGVARWGDLRAAPTLSDDG